MLVVPWPATAQPRTGENVQLLPATTCPALQVGAASAGRAAAKTVTAISVCSFNGLTVLFSNRSWMQWPCKSFKPGSEFLYYPARFGIKNVRRNAGIAAWEGCA